MSLGVPRSGYEKVGDLVYFGRCIDKIRFRAAGSLSADYNLGVGLDERLCQFLQVDYAALRDRVLQGGGDEEILAWCFQQGRKPADEAILMFNHFMAKRGWRDEFSGRLQEQMARLGLSERKEDIRTFFDLHDADERRPPRFP